MQPGDHREGGEARSGVRRDGVGVIHTAIGFAMRPSIFR
jgi:hypothetical protein